MDDATEKPANALIPQADSFGLAFGSQPLRNAKHEIYCRERSLLRSKIEAYRAAGFGSTSDHNARGNAGKLERRAEVQARIAYLSRDEEAKHREARRRLEERLWLYHDGNVADYWMTVEVEMHDKKGNVVHDADGKPVMRKINRPKLFAELTDEQKTRIESVALNDAGIAVPRLYSAAWANEQLRKLHNIGPTTRGDDDVRRLSDAELIAQLVQQAEELGIQIDLSYRLGGDQCLGLYPRRRVAGGSTPGA
jgi:hypothetical protein